MDFQDVLRLTDEADIKVTKMSKTEFDLGETLSTEGV